MMRDAQQISCKTEWLQNSAGVERGHARARDVCYLLILWWRASEDPFTAKHKGHARTTSTAHLVSKRPLWPRLRPVFQIIIPSNYWHVLHKWPLDKVTTLRKNVNMCRTVAMLWGAHHWPKQQRRHINYFFSGTTKNNIQSCVIASYHNWTATALSFPFKVDVHCFFINKAL